LNLSRYAETEEGIAIVRESLEPALRKNLRNCFRPRVRVSYEQQKILEECLQIPVLPYTGKAVSSHPLHSCFLQYAEEYLYGMYGQTGDFIEIGPNISSFCALENTGAHACLKVDNARDEQRIIAAIYSCKQNRLSTGEHRKLFSQVSNFWRSRNPTENFCFRGSENCHRKSKVAISNFSIHDIDFPVMYDIFNSHDLEILDAFLFLPEEIPMRKRAVNEELGYSYRTVGDRVFISFASDESLTYDHSYEILKRYATQTGYVGQTFNLLFEIRRRIGPMVQLRITRSVFGGQFSRTITKFSNSYVRVPDIQEYFLTRGKSRRWDIVCRRHTMDRAITYFTENKDADLTKESFGTYLRALTTGMKINNTVLLDSMNIGAEDFTRLSLSLYLMAFIMKNKREKICRFLKESVAKEFGACDFIAKWFLKFDRWWKTGEYGGPTEILSSFRKFRRFGENIGAEMLNVATGADLYEEGQWLLNFAPDMCSEVIYTSDLVTHVPEIPLDIPTHANPREYFSCILKNLDGPSTPVVEDEERNFAPAFLGKPLFTKEPEFRYNVSCDLGLGSYKPTLSPHSREVVRLCSQIQDTENVNDFKRLWMERYSLFYRHNQPAIVESLVDEGTAVTLPECEQEEAILEVEPQQTQNVEVRKVLEKYLEELNKSKTDIKELALLKGKLKRITEIAIENVTNFPCDQFGTQWNRYQGGGPFCGKTSFICKEVERLGECLVIAPTEKLCKEHINRGLKSVTYEVALVKGLNCSHIFVDEFTKLSPGYLTLLRVEAENIPITFVGDRSQGWYHDREGIYGDPKTTFDSLFQCKEGKFLSRSHAPRDVVNILNAGFDYCLESLSDIQKSIEFKPLLRFQDVVTKIPKSFQIISFDENTRDRVNRMNPEREAKTVMQFQGSRSNQVALLLTLNGRMLAQMSEQAVVSMTRHSKELIVYDETGAARVYLKHGNAIAQHIRVGLDLPDQGETVPIDLNPLEKIRESRPRFNHNASDPNVCVEIASKYTAVSESPFQIVHRSQLKGEFVGRINENVKEEMNTLKGRRMTPFSLTKKFNARSGPEALKALGSRAANVKCNFLKEDKGKENLIVEGLIKKVFDRQIDRKKLKYICSDADRLLPYFHRAEVDFTLKVKEKGQESKYGDVDLLKKNHFVTDYFLKTIEKAKLYSESPNTTDKNGQTIAATDKEMNAIGAVFHRAADMILRDCCKPGFYYANGESEIKLGLRMAVDRQNGVEEQSAFKGDDSLMMTEDQIIEGDFVEFGMTQGNITVTFEKGMYNEMSLLGLALNLYHEAMLKRKFVCNWFSLWVKLGKNDGATNTILGNNLWNQAIMADVVDKDGRTLTVNQAKMEFWRKRGLQFKIITNAKVARFVNWFWTETGAYPDLLYKCMKVVGKQYVSIEDVENHKQAVADFLIAVGTNEELQKAVACCSTYHNIPVGEVEYLAGFLACFAYEIPAETLWESMQNGDVEAFVENNSQTVGGN